MQEYNVAAAGRCGNFRKMDIYKRQQEQRILESFSLFSHLMNSKSACWEPGSRPFRGGKAGRIPDLKSMAGADTKQHPA